MSSNKKFFGLNSSSYPLMMKKSTEFYEARKEDGGKRLAAKR